LDHALTPPVQWHATLSSKDAQWLEAALKKNLPPDDPAQTDPEHEWTKLDFGRASASVIACQGTDPRGWTFGGCVRVPFFSPLFFCE
jgi:hypothetical protein